MASLRQSYERRGAPLGDTYERIKHSLAPWAPIPLRLIVGYGFMEHGFAKLARGPDSFATILAAIGVPAPHFMAWSTVIIEIFGGLAILLGAFVVLISVPMAVVLLVAPVQFTLALRLQLDQAPGGHSRRRTIWAAGLRM